MRLVDLLVVYSEKSECQSLVWNSLTQDFYHEFLKDSLTHYSFPNGLLSSQIVLSNQFLVIYMHNSGFDVISPGNTENMYSNRRYHALRVSPTLLLMEGIQRVWVSGGFMGRHDLKHDLKAIRTTAYLDLSRLEMFPGPDMPLALSRHCAVDVSQTKVTYY